MTQRCHGPCCSCPLTSLPHGRRLSGRGRRHTLHGLLLSSSRAEPGAIVTGDSQVARSKRRPLSSTGDDWGCRWGFPAPGHRHPKAEPEAPAQEALGEAERVNGDRGHTLGMSGKPATAVAPTCPGDSPCSDAAAVVVLLSRRDRTRLRGGLPPERDQRKQPHADRLVHRRHFRTHPAAKRNTRMRDTRRNAPPQERSLQSTGSRRREPRIPQRRTRGLLPWSTHRKPRPPPEPGAEHP